MKILNREIKVNNKRIISLIFFIIVLFIVFFFIASREKKEVLFYRINNTEIYLYNKIEDVINVNSNLTINLDYRNVIEGYDRIYFVFDPNLSGNFVKGYIQIQAEFLYPLKYQYNKTIVEACLYNTTECYKKGIPVLSCKKVEDGLCIEYRKGKLGLYQIDNYILISGNEENILKATDLFIAKFYGLS